MPEGRGEAIACFWYLELIALHFFGAEKLETFVQQCFYARSASPKYVLDKKQRSPFLGSCRSLSTITCINHKGDHRRAFPL